MPESNVSNPFDIKDSPIFYAMFEYYKNSYGSIKKITPVIFSNHVSIPTVIGDNLIYIGMFEAATTLETVQMEIVFNDETDTDCFSLYTNESVGLNFTHNVHSDYLFFNYAGRWVNVSNYKFIGFKLEW